MKISLSKPTHLLAMFCLLAISNFALADDEILAQLKSCALISDDSKRIACYEALGKKALEAESSAQIATETEPKSLPAGLGGADFARKEGIEKKVTINRGKVTSCKKGLSGKWFYFFENGQIWKQTDTRKRSYRGGCEFYVDIWKDGFGYLMRVDGEKRKTAIKRQQ